jgi:photosystem II stability/assembly factor-like uncharacterized protein
MALARPLARLLSGGAAAIALLALAPAAVTAQGFQAVHSKNGVDVWAVGDGGAWSRSFDGGATWTSGQLTTARTLRGVAHRGTTVLVVADSGQVFRSTDNGVSWARSIVGGTSDLKAIEMPGDAVAVICGAGEKILRSEDGGASWTPQGPGGAATLHGLRMTSELEGWAVGSGGRVLRTTDGGTNWVPVATPTTNDLFAVDASGLRVWVVGGHATALRSTTGGSAWDTVHLRMELPGDLRAVRVSGAGEVILTGGGGFIRSSGDDGATWTFASHPLIAATTDYFQYDASRAWASAARTKAVVRTANGGTTWALPTGTTTTWDWQLKRASGNVTVRGNTFATTPQNRNSVWCVLGPNVYKSLDRGDSWTQVATIPSTSKTNSFYVSPEDSNKWVAAVGTPDRIVVTTNAGGAWSTGMSADFTEYGMPLEMNPDKPDTLLFGPEDGRIWRSTDFGASWAILSNPGFRSPCDLVISPDNEANVVVGDGVTGIGLAKIWQSEDGALGFSDRYTGSSSETPTVWSSRLGNTVIFATNWSSGGVWRSNDSGKSWGQVTTVTSAWGGATATDDPKLVVYNRYAGSPNYVSTDGGTTFTSSSLLSPGSGYAMTTLDRSTILDMHSGGIYKLGVFYTVPAAAAQAVALVSPDGGEAWAAGSVQPITWTATNLALVSLEWRSGAADPWQPIAQVEGAAGAYAWTVPAVATTAAQVRVRDAADGTPVDQSSATFTILAPAIAVTPLAIAFGDHAVGSATTDSVRITNTGTADLHVSLANGTSAFYPGRRVLVFAAGASDTVGVTFAPTLAAGYEDTLVVTSDGGDPVRVVLSGSGQAVAGLTLLAPNGGEAWQYGKGYPVRWEGPGLGTVALDYRRGELDPWIEIAAALPAVNGLWMWTIPFDTTTEARVRVREVGGNALSDESDAPFALTAPSFLTLPEPLDFGPTPLGYVTWDTLRIENKGTAPLTVTGIASDNPLFTVTPDTAVVLAGSWRLIEVHYGPVAAGPDSALLTFAADDPAAPHAVRVYGSGQPQVGVDPIPLAFGLEMPRPNPFSRETSIRFALPQPTDVALEVFDLGGRRVAVLVQGPLPAGVHAVAFRPRTRGAGGRGALSSGVYFVRLTAGAFSRTQKILHLAP